MSWPSARRATIAAAVVVFAGLIVWASLNHRSANADPHVAAVERRFGIHVLARLSQQESRVSQAWADGTYVPIARTLEASGYSLAGLAGQDVVLTEYLIRERHEGWPLTVVLVTHDDRLVGGFATVEPSALAGEGNLLALSEITGGR